MKEETETTLLSEDLKKLSTEVVDIFLALSLVLEEHTRNVTSSEKIEKRKIFFAPLDVSLGLASADLIKDSRCTSYLLCTHILRTIGSLQSQENSPLYGYLGMVSPELRSIIVQRDFDDRHPIIVAVLKEFGTFYALVQPPRADVYWRLKNQHKYRISTVLSKRKDWTIAFAKILYSMHYTYKDRCLKSGMGLVSTYLQ